MLIHLNPRLSHAAARASLACLSIFIGLLFGAAVTVPGGAIAEGDSAPVCGDANGDGDVSTSDALRILLFSSGQAAACVPPACDANDSGAVTVTDALVVLGLVVGMDIEAVCPDGIEVDDSDVLDFEDLTAGQVIDSTTSLGGIGPVGVSGFNPNANFDESLNSAIVYDSSCAAGCTGGDIDLGSSNQDFGGPGIGDGGVSP